MATLHQSSVCTPEAVATVPRLAATPDRNREGWAMLRRVVLIAVSVFPATDLHAETRSVTFVDPVGDQAGRATWDVTRMVLTWNSSTGDYSLKIATTSSAPFAGQFRINVNLFNPDQPDATSFFQDVVNDFDLATPSVQIVLKGISGGLTSWQVGDRVASSTLAGVGNPPGSSFFRSSVSALPMSGGFLTDEDAIAYDVNNLVAVSLDEAPPAITIDDRAVAEGNAVNASFRVVLSRPVTDPVTVAFTTQDASAVAPADYVATSGTLTFTPGRTTHSIIVPIVSDAVAEGTETFSVLLSAPVNATVADSQAVGTLTDPPGPANTRMYRAYNPNVHYHFFTTAFPEYANAVSAGYQDETTGLEGFCVSNTTQAGAVAIFRMYNPVSGRHYYSSAAGERDALRDIGWVYEKDEGWVFSGDTVSGVTEIYKLYNVNTGTHLYTESEVAKDSILATFPDLWVQHGSLGFAFLSAPDGTCP